MNYFHSLLRFLTLLISFQFREKCNDDPKTHAQQNGCSIFGNVIQFDSKVSK